MAHFSNYAESGILNWLFRANTNSFARPSAIAIALCYGVPTETQNGATIPELPNANGYQRYAVTQNNSNWTESNQVANSGFIENAVEFLFSTLTGDVGHISGYAIVDNSTWGAGNVIICGSFPTARDAKANDAPVIRAGLLDLYLG